ncbi:MAG: phosphatidylglycerophosphatase A [Opitutales bacterium]
MRQPMWIRLLPTPIVLNLATLWRLGFIGKAPGTNGSLVGLLWFTLLFYPLGIFGTLLLGGITVYLAIVICGEAEIRMSMRDPSEVILDEMVAIPFCFLGLQHVMWSPNAWILLITGFLLFRFFDILKPLGINQLQKLPGGLGVVLDDVAAAVLTAIVLHILVYFAPFL